MPRAIEILEELPPGELAPRTRGQRYLRMLSRDNAEGVMGRARARLAVEVGDPTSAGHRAQHDRHLARDGRARPSAARAPRAKPRARAERRTTSCTPRYSMLASGLGEMYGSSSSERAARDGSSRSPREHDLDIDIRSWLAATLVRTLGRRHGAGAGSWLGHQPDQPHHGADRPRLARAVRRGDPDVADALDEALELADPAGISSGSAPSARRAEAAWLAGDRERARRGAEPHDLALEKRHLWFAGELAYWQWKAGALEARPTGSPSRTRSRSPATRRAADAWTAHGCPYEAARALAEADDESSSAKALDAASRASAHAPRATRRPPQRLGACASRGGRVRHARERRRR